MTHRRFISLVLFLLPALMLLTVQTPASQAQIRLANTPSFAQQVLEMVNQQRWQNGQLPPLKSESALHSAAETHSTNMALRDFFNHCDLDTGTLPWDRMNDAGYKDWNYAGENIAAGYGTPAQVMAAWMASSGHRANILSTEPRELGVGYFYQEDDQGNVREDSNADCQADSADSGPYFNYWTQNFGRRETVMPVIINREAYETTSRQANLFLYGAGWAHSMRLRNETENWSSWQPFAADVNWSLSCGNGSKIVYAEMSSGPNGAGTIRSAQDEIFLNSGPGSLLLSPGALSFVAHVVNGPDTLVRNLTIENVGGQIISWTITENPAAVWLNSSLTGGKLGACGLVELFVTISLTGLKPGVYSTTLLITDETNNTTWQIPVNLLYTDQTPLYLPVIVK